MPNNPQPALPYSPLKARAPRRGGAASTPVAPAGFTLIELMVVVAIMAMLLGWAAPNLQQFVTDARFSRSADALYQAVKFARSTAMTQSNRVAVCASINTTEDAPICRTANRANWSDGWLIFEDCDADGVRDVINVCDTTGDGAADAAEPVLKVQDTLSPLTLKTATGPNVLSFNRNGRSDNTVTFNLTDDGSSKTQKTTVNTFGRVRTE